MDNRKFEADAIGTAPAEPAAPSAGYPTNGDPTSGQSATEPGAYWFHAVGEEIRAVIAAGGLTPAIGALNQMKLAIDALIADATPDASTTVKGIVELSTDAEVLEGTDTVKAITPSGLNYRIYQIIDTTDILLNNYATPGYSNIGSPFVVNIHSPCLIRFASFAGRLLNNATAAAHGVVFGIRIASTNYWFTYLDSNGTLSVVNQLNGGSVANNYTEWKGYEGAVPGVMNLSNMGVPSGLQTVQLIAAYQTTQCTLKGTVAVTRVQLEFLG